MTVRRIAQTIRLRPERREEYLRLHAAVWPGVEAALHAAHITNYSIFLRGDTLFAYYEYTGDDLAADMAAIAADPETQRWWRLTDPCQEPWPDRGAGGNWSDLTEIWHLSAPPSAGEGGPQPGLDS
jgi:L-rhamnose mutarotase